MLFGLSAKGRYWLYGKPVDMRKGFDGLAGLVSGELGQDPLSGDVFIFINRRRTHAKLLCWDFTGYVIYYKRLERGTFEVPASGLLSREVLLMLLEGIALGSVRRKRYRLEK